ncbi:hypothetical protein [Clostridium beijerinckii]|uniref:Adenylosuccinate synthase n=1 Tax=Clostridium beijerinckii TaxID=1520 RepID=A0AAX0BAZ4_CLOBE|nr:adenylosuccinate synthase [Clostridium beijerinckii]NYC71154.1 adenylosuccinate synthase [Clostridium beijerinckii]
MNEYMEERSILIQSDEVTKNIMGEIQDDMLSLLSRASRNMTEELTEKLKPVERKINDLRENFQEFHEEEFEEKLEDLNKSILKIREMTEMKLESVIQKSVEEQSKVLFESIEERLAILGLKVVKDAASNKEAILDKLDNINLDKIEEKVDLVEKSIENKVESLEKSMEYNLINNKNSILGKIKDIDSKIEDKDSIIELISKLEDELNNKIDYIQEEVEWGNKSFFSKLFGRRR